MAGGPGLLGGGVQMFWSVKLSVLGVYVGPHPCKLGGTLPPEPAGPWSMLGHRGEDMRSLCSICQQQEASRLGESGCTSGNQPWR